jgi:integrase/recombinase XerD
MDRRTIVIKEAKGGKNRIIQFNDDVYEALKLWLIIKPHKDSEALITGKFGKRLDSSYIRDMIKEQCKKAKIFKSVPITPHSFRHMFITNCIEDGVLLPELSHYVGHSSIDMTASYIAIAKLGNSMTKFKGIHKEE